MGVKTKGPCCAVLRRSIAQGCSEYNITVLINQKDSVRALRAVHGRFYLATLPLGVGIIGPGLIGGTFLDQIHAQIAVCTFFKIVFSWGCLAEICQILGLQLFHAFESHGALCMGLQELRDEFDIDVRVLGIMSSSRMLLSDTALDLSTWRDQFQQ